MHDLVVGLTGRGKSRLLKEKIIPQWRKRGRLSLVFDPIGQQWPAGARVTSDGFQLIKWAKESRNCIIVVDEVRVLRENWKLEQESIWLATIARNFGHKSYFSGQFAVHAHPSIRGNCSTLWAFTQNPRDSAVLESEWNVSGLGTTLPRLPKGVCIRAEVCGTPVKYRTFDDPSNALEAGCMALW